MWVMYVSMTGSSAQDDRHQLDRSVHTGKEEGVGWHTRSISVLLVEARLNDATLLFFKLLSPAHVTAVAGAAFLPRNIHW
jgi:hypothetical protein